MYKLMTQCIFIYIIWCSSLMVCKTSSEVISGRSISRLIEEVNASKLQASALIRSHPRRILNYSKFHEMPNSDVYVNSRIQKEESVMKSDNSNISTFLKIIQPSFGDYVLFGRAKRTSGRSQRVSEIENRNIPSKEEFALQEMHLRYLMSSTAEQPDNSGRTSTFNMWLTILIAALAAAILS